MRAFVIPILGVLALATLCGGPAHGVGFSVVLATGDPAPDTGGGTIAAVSAPLLNESGQVAVNANVDSSPLDLGGLWGPTPGGGLGLVALVGEPAPGTGGAPFSSRCVGDLDDLGNVACEAQVTASPPANQGIWTRSPSGSTELLARTGDVAPGSTLQFAAFVTPLAGGGRVAFRAPLAVPPGSFHWGVYRTDAGGALGLVTQTGAAAPGGTSTFSTFSDLAMNEAGQVAFQAEQASGVEGIWRAAADSGPALVALENTAAPGTPAGVRFSSFQPPVMNEAGELAFFSNLVGSAAGVNPDNNTALFGPNGTGGLRLVMREGAAAPGMGPGVLFADRSGFTGGFGVPALSDAGRIAFTAFVDGTGVTAANDRGLWATDAGGALQLLVRKGDPVPGLLGTSFLDLPHDEVQLNGAGDVLFQARLFAPGGEGNGIFWIDAAGGITPLVHTGQSLEIAPGEFRTVLSVSMTNAALNEARQVALGITFAEGSAALLFSLASVPEPGLAALTAAAGLALARRRR